MVQQTSNDIDYEAADEKALSSQIEEAKGSSNGCEVRDLPLAAGPSGEDVLRDVHTGINDGVKRTMKQRHITMFAFAGTLGTGLFLSSGRAIVNAGPVGALICYLLVGSLIWSEMQCLGEMICFAPVSGGYVHFASRFVHPSLGFAFGWMKFYADLVSYPGEIVSASLIIGFWFDPFPVGIQVGFYTVFLAITIGINLCGARVYGEAEFWFAIIKIMLIIGLIIGGIVIDLGGGPNGDRIGFRYWVNPGPFSTYLVTGAAGRFAGIFITMFQAAYAYSGLEATAMAAAELENPRPSIAKAIRRVFWRIAIFYILGIFVVGLLVPSSDRTLLTATGNASSSPFVRAFERAGVTVLPSVVNVGVLTSAVSAAQSNNYTASRILYGLSLRGQAPRVFSRVTKRGVPVIAVFAASALGPLSYMSISSGGATVLTWLTNITSTASFFTWLFISISFIRYKQACDSQGIDRKASPYMYNRWQPYPAYWVIFLCIVCLLGAGFGNFINGHWNTSTFITNYITMVFVTLLITGHWLYTGRKPIMHPRDIDMVSNIPGPEIDVDRNPPTTRVEKFLAKVL